MAPLNGDPPSSQNDNRFFSRGPLAPWGKITHFMGDNNICNRERKEEIERQIVRMILRSGLSLCFAENPHFQDLVTLLNPAYAKTNNPFPGEFVKLCRVDLLASTRTTGHTSCCCCCHFVVVVVVVVAFAASAAFAYDDDDDDDADDDDDDALALAVDVVVVVAFAFAASFAASSFAATATSGATAIVVATVVVVVASSYVDVADDCSAAACFSEHVFVYVCV